MCKPKKPKAPKIPEPVIMTNPLLDATRSPTSVALAARAGRSSLRIPLNNGLGIGFSGRTNVSASTRTAGPQGNARRATANAGLGVVQGPPTSRPAPGLRPGGIPR